MIANTATDTATLILAVGTAVASMGGAVAAILAARRSGEVRTDTVRIRDEVTTLNGKTLAMLADAIETRRIEDLKPVERTEADEEHLEIVPDADDPTPDFPKPLP